MLKIIFEAAVTVALCWLMFAGSLFMLAVNVLKRLADYIGALLGDAKAGLSGF